MSMTTKITTTNTDNKDYNDTHWRQRLQYTPTCQKLWSNCSINQLFRTMLYKSGKSFCYELEVRRLVM